MAITCLPQRYFQFLIVASDIVAGDGDASLEGTLLLLLLLLGYGYGMGLMLLRIKGCGCDGISLNRLSRQLLALGCAACTDGTAGTAGIWYDV